jgi:hypothetical protein
MNKFLYQLFTGNQSGGYGILRLAGFNSLVHAGPIPRTEAGMAKLYPFPPSHGVLLQGDHQRDDELHPGFSVGLIIGVLILSGVPKDDILRGCLRSTDNRTGLPSVYLEFYTLSGKLRFLSNHSLMPAWRYIRYDGGLITSFDSATSFKQPNAVRQYSAYDTNPANRDRMIKYFDRCATPHDDMAAVKMKRFFDAGSVSHTAKAVPKSAPTDARLQYHQAPGSQQQSAPRSIFKPKSNRSLGKTSSHPVQFGPSEQEEQFEGDYMSNEPPVPQQQQTQPPVPPQFRPAAFRTYAGMADSLRSTLYHMAQTDSPRTIAILTDALKDMIARENDHISHQDMEDEVDNDAGSSREKKRKDTKRTPDPVPPLENLAITSAVGAASSSSPDRMEVDKTPNGQHLALTPASADHNGDGTSC